VEWEQSPGSVSASPSIASEAAGSAVYVAVNRDGGAELQKLVPENGTRLAGCGPYPSSTIEASIALDPAPATAEDATILVNGARRLVRSIGCTESSAADVEAKYPMGLARKGSSLYFADSDGGIRALDLSPGDEWIPRSGWPAITYSLVRGVALLDNEIVWSQVNGLAGVTFSGSGSSEAFFVPGGWAPSIGAPDYVLVGSDDGRFTSIVWSSKTEDRAYTGAIRGAPLHGRDGFMYSASLDGYVSAWQRGIRLWTPIWQSSKLEPFEASPNIDCSRDVSGAPIPGRPGVLYVASNLGELYALLVDDRGIDVNAPWPKYQHDPRNTGNADTPLAEFACP
jgi:hypothetical protein